MPTLYNLGNTTLKNSHLRAITTRYKGYSFRSRLEARWAVFFDHLGIRWDYEPEGFELGNGLRYLPDFWLPDLALWVEVKPTDEMDFVSLEKAFRLAQQSESPVYLTGGMPDGVGRLLYKAPEGVQVAKARAAWAGCMPAFDGHGLFFAAFDNPTPTGDYLPHQHGDALTLVSDGVPEDYPAPSHADLFYGALAAARSARFEYGHKGAA